MKFAAKQLPLQQKLVGQGEVLIDLIGVYGGSQRIEKTDAEHHSENQEHMEWRHGHGAWAVFQAEQGSSSTGHKQGSRGDSKTGADKAEQ